MSEYYLNFARHRSSKVSGYQEILPGVWMVFFHVLLLLFEQPNSHKIGHAAEYEGREDVAENVDIMDAVLAEVLVEKREDFQRQWRLMKKHSGVGIEADFGEANALKKPFVSVQWRGQFRPLGEAEKAGF